MGNIMGLPQHHKKWESVGDLDQGFGGVPPGAYHADLLGTVADGGDDVLGGNPIPVHGIGDLVEKDAPLFVIDKDPFEAALASAEAAVAKAQAQLKLSETQLARASALVERKAATPEPKTTAMPIAVPRARDAMYFFNGSSLIAVAGNPDPSNEARASDLLYKAYLLKCLKTGKDWPPSSKW